MTPLVAAFSLQEEIEKYGAYAGIAAVVGLGVLALLYFAQAREVKRLREWAGRAPERAAEIEARVSADAQRRVTAVPVPRPAQPPIPPGTVPSPSAGAVPAAGPAGVGAAVPATAAAAAAGASAVTAGAPRPPGAPPAQAQPQGAPATAVTTPGQGAPANGTPPGGAPAIPTAPPPSPASTAATAATPASPSATPAPTTPAPAPGAGSPPPSSPASPAAPPSPVPAPPAIPAATTAAAAGAAAQRAQPLRIPTPQTSVPTRQATERPAPAAAPARAGDGNGTGRHLRLFVSIVAGVVVLGLLVVVLATQVLGGDDPANTTPNRVAAPGATEPSGSSTTGGEAQPQAVERGDFTVVVLNGTRTTGLAAQVSNGLVDRGYVEGGRGDDPSQGRATTAVFYADGARAAALDIAKLLEVDRSAARPLAEAEAETRTAVQALNANAQIVVSVGADKTQ